MANKQYMTAAKGGGQVHNIGLTVRPIKSPLAVFSDNFTQQKQNTPKKKSSGKSPNFDKLKSVESTIPALQNLMSNQLEDMRNDMITNYYSRTPEENNLKISEYTKTLSNYNTSLNSQELLMDEYTKKLSNEDGNPSLLANEYALSNSDKVYIRTRDGIKEVSMFEASKPDKDGNKPYILSNSELASALRNGYIPFGSLGEFNNIYGDYFGSKLSSNDVLKKINENISKSGSSSIKVEGNNQGLTLVSSNGRKINFDLKGDGDDKYYSASTDGGGLDFNKFLDFVGHENISKDEALALRKSVKRQAMDEFYNLSDDKIKKLNSDFSKVYGRDPKDNDELMKYYIGEESKGLLQSMVFSSISLDASINNADEKALKRTAGSKGKYGITPKAVLPQREYYNTSSDDETGSVNNRISMTSIKDPNGENKAGYIDNSSYLKVTVETGGKWGVKGVNSGPYVSESDIYVSQMNDINLVARNMTLGNDRNIRYTASLIADSIFNSANNPKESDRVLFENVAQRIYRQYFLNEKNELYKEGKDRGGKTVYNSNIPSPLINEKGELINNSNPDIVKIYNKVKETFKNRSFMSFPVSKDKDGKPLSGSDNYIHLGLDAKIYDKYWDILLNNKSQTFKLLSSFKSSNKNTQELYKDSISALLDKGIKLSDMNKSELDYAMRFIKAVNNPKEYQEKTKALKKNIDKEFDELIVKDLKELDDNNLKVVAIGFDDSWVKTFKNNTSGINFEPSKKIIANSGYDKYEFKAYDALKGTGLAYVKTASRQSAYESAFNKMDDDTKLKQLRVINNFIQDNEFYDKFFTNDEDAAQYLTKENGENKSSIYVMATLKRIGNILGDEAVITKEKLNNGEYDKIVSLFSMINPAKAYYKDALETEKIIKIVADSKGGSVVGTSPVTM